MNQAVALSSIFWKPRAFQSVSALPLLSISFAFQSMGREGGRQILMRAGLFCVSQAIDEDANS